MKIHRRTIITSLATTIAATTFAFAVSIAMAAQPVVEIIGFAHPPVQSALKPLREWLASQATKLRVLEMDMDTPAAEKRLQAIGLKGHIPIVILIDGKYKHTRKDGSVVEFVSFPTNTPDKGWIIEDVQTVLKDRK